MELKAKKTWIKKPSVPETHNTGFLRWEPEFKKKMQNYKKNMHDTEVNIAEMHNDTTEPPQPFLLHFIALFTMKNEKTLRLWDEKESLVNGWLPNWMYRVMYFCLDTENQNITHFKALLFLNQNIWIPHQANAKSKLELWVF